MIRESFLLCALVCFVQLAFAQESKLSWTQHLKAGDAAYEEAQYAKAAEHYELAWRQKPKRKEFISAAGKCYLIVKNYKKAAFAFKQLTKDVKDYPKANLHYAQSLKQNEEYEKAIKAFETFIKGYSGEDATTLAQAVQLEIEGCKLAEGFLAMTKSSVRILHVDESVNSTSTDFAPVPFGNDELFFSSTKLGKAKIFQTQKSATKWTEPLEMQQFSDLEMENMCNTALSPDEKRLYFTVCKSVESWGALTTRCEIYVSQRLGTLWSAPERLPDNINTPTESVTTTHPSIVHANGMEVLYFSSNRDGGQGNMDIWYSVRELDGGNLNFSNPRNAGAKINTEQNEITPFYDAREGTLYFSSNGHRSVGGLDIFSVDGELSKWGDMPINIGLPYNSGADDYFYIQNRYGDGGFLVSNRRFGDQKKKTEHEDIFEFKLRSEHVCSIKGIVYDQENTVPMENAEVTVYEVLGNQREKMVQSMVVAAKGEYEFKVLPNRDYKVVAHKMGYTPATRAFKADNGGAKTEHLYLSPPTAMQEGIVRPSPMPEPPKMPQVTTAPARNVSQSDSNSFMPSEPTMTNLVFEDTDTYTYTPDARNESFEISTNAPRLDGHYYKVQIIALSKFEPAEKRYNRVRHLGRLDFEFLTGRKLNRVLLADFTDKTDALEALNTARHNGFPTAFLVAYRDGKRIGRTK